ncbi:swi5-dependent recombination DNA repair protein 1 homolog [Colossoma macropomum]|uniref:swi5-dependent recombination DNA repair protein 1 homolog n=1 Tax=Colossoma macropomum TaxID=42526 RepID=UPI0018643F95|nr:swi5-dependent recombination DNA repair protein 1 homolog [Colossoma macropomum]
MDKTPERLPVEQQTSVPSGSSVGKPMSAALKARLKRARPSFTSPLSVVKRLKIDEDELPQPLKEETDQTGPPEKEAEIDVNRNETMRDLKDCLRSFESDPLQLSRSELHQLREKLKKDAKKKSETLRRLKMVKMYRTKNDLTQLQDLIDKWRHCAQAVLYELQTELPTDGRKASLSQLIDHFGLEDGILHFDRTEDNFTDS